MALNVDFIPDWAARLRTRLYTQFRNKVTWNAFCDLLGEQFDALERSAQTLFSIRNIDDSEGVQLDIIGRIVGQKRLGQDDPTYRDHIRARILTNRSFGTAENIYSVFVQLHDMKFQLLPGYVKQFVFRMISPITYQQSRAATDFLSDSKEAGARGILEWQEFASEQLFTFQTGSVLNVAVSGGATTLNVPDTSNFFGGGALRLDFGTASDETVASHTVTGATTLSVPALANAHAVGAAVEALNGIGKGFGNASNSTTGGLFQQAEEV